MRAGGNGSPGHFCLVVTELLGHRGAGGIATATSYTAELLAQAGHRVTLFDASPEEEVLSAEWQARYRRNHITVERLDRTERVAPPFVADSYRTYHQLKGRDDLDVIVFQDWRGLGYCSMSAKRSGLAFAGTRLVHIVHGPMAWLWEANETVTLDTESFAAALIEQRAAEWADTVLGPSRYLVDWMARRWDLGLDRRVVPYPTARQVGDGPPRAEHVWQPAPLEELVFFGRFEDRKGIRVYTEALNRIGPERLAGMRLTFLGRPVPHSCDEVAAMLRPAVTEAVDGPHFIIDRDSHAARAYLRQPGRLAVIPSLIDNSPNVVIECVEDGVSFVGAASGGIPELVAEADRPRLLVEPRPAPLADLLGRIVDAGTTPPPARPGWDETAVLPAWEELLVAPRVRVAPPARPPVSVIIPHHDQLALLTHTLASVARQDHPELEIVVVDDGSADAATRDALVELTGRPWGRPVQLVRQDNRYLGAARNTGVGAAHHDLLAFVDDDDLVEPSYVSTMVTALTATGAAAVASVLVATLDDGALLDTRAGTPFVFLGDGAHLASSWNTVGGAGCLVTREAWHGVGGFHEHHGTGHEDWTFLLAILLSGRPVVAVPEPLYRYRIRADSMLRSTTRYRNMRPVLDVARAAMPAVFATVPEQLHGQQQTIDDLRKVEADLRQDKALLERELHRATRRIAELEAAGRERDELISSTTWKVGSVALAPLRVWRDVRAARRDGAEAGPEPAGGHR